MENIKEAIIPMFEGDIKGIAIDPFMCKTQLGKLKNINYPNFKYLEEEKWISREDDERSKKPVKFIQVVNLPDNLIVEVVNSINAVLNEENITVAKAIDKIIDYFKKVKFHKDIAQELMGDLGEAIFILKSFESGYDVMKHLRVNDNNTYDFYSNEKVFEVKSTSLEKNEMILTHEQMVQIKEKKIVVVKFKVVAAQTTLLDIYDMISKFGTLDDLLVQKQKHWKSIKEQCALNAKNDILADYAVILDKVKLGIFKNENLPDVEIKNMNACKKITYSINCTDSETENIVQFYKWLGK